MAQPSEQQMTVLSLAPISQNPNVGRWRTEAMRSHSTPRLLYISKGQGRITIAGLTRGYGPNNLIFIPAHTMYGYEVGPTVLGQILTIPNAMAPEWPDESQHLRLRDVLVQTEASSLMDAMERELATSRGNHSRAAHYHLGLLSVYFERQIDVKPTETHHQASAARLVAAYTDLVERSYRSNMRVSDYAATLGVTTTHLTRCCNQTCGKSALGILKDRIHFEACTLLRATRTPVQDIARDLGFHSAAYFSRSFQATSGRTPTSFRRFGAAARRG